jgi:hypothetical protein
MLTQEKRCTKKNSARKTETRKQHKVAKAVEVSKSVTQKPTEIKVEIHKSTEWKFSTLHLVIDRTRQNYV